MSKLVNQKHETLAKELAKGTSKEQAYQIAYECALPSAKRVYALIREEPAIMERQTELLDLQGLDKVYLNSKLKGIIERPENQAIQHDVCKTVLKMHGVLDTKAPLIDARQVHITDQSTNTSMKVEVEVKGMTDVVERLGSMNQSLSFTNSNAVDGEILPTNDEEHHNM